ncbi:MAG TPA: group 1 truncated hemoglobin [Alphaproteobacteria bacterium]
MIASLRILLLAALLAAAGPWIHGAAADDELYRSFGGRDVITKIVDDATDRWVADERIKDTFDNINLVRFKRLLTDQICELTGGPFQYKGRNMYESHKGLHLNQKEFNALVEGLQEAMDKYKIPFWTQNRLIVLLAPMERDIVTR